MYHPEVIPHPCKATEHPTMNTVVQISHIAVVTSILLQATVPYNDQILGTVASSTKP